MLTYCYRVLNLMFTEFSRFSTGMLMRFALQQFLLIFFRRVTEFIIGLVRSFWPFGSVGVVGFRSADRPFWVGRLFCFGATFVFFFYFLPFALWWKRKCRLATVWYFYFGHLRSFSVDFFLTSFSIFPSFFRNGFQYLLLVLWVSFCVCVCVCLRTCVEKMRRSVLFLLLLFF